MNTILFDIWILMWSEWSEYIYRFSGKEKQLFWNLKFHAVLSTLFRQITQSLNCHIAIVSSWCHWTSPVPKWKYTPTLWWRHSTSPCQPCDDPAHQRPFQVTLHTPIARLGRGLDINPLYTKTQVVYSPLPHKWSIILCLERLSGKNRITQEPVYWFASQINLLVPIWHKSLLEVIFKHTVVWK